MTTASILLVEDERGMRETLAANLEVAGHQVTGCKSGEEGLLFIRQDLPDVVISDLRLPDISGLELLEALKEVKPEAAFILITGHASLESAIEALNDGAFAYINKPFKMDEVNTVIRNALRQQRLLLENQKLVDSLQQANTELSGEIAERQRAQETLEELRRQHELILNSAGEGIYGIDSQGNTTFVNPAAARMLGHEVDELIGKSAHTIWHHSKPDGTPFAVEECSIHSSSENGIQSQLDDEAFWRNNGTNFPVEYTRTLIKDEQSDQLGAVITFKDITGRLEVDRMKDEFISVVSHKLRTPLTSIRGSLGLIASGGVGPNGVDRMVQMAMSNTDRLVRLINDILDIERMESGRVSLEPRPCSNEDLVAQARDLVSESAQQAGVTISAAPQPAQVIADPDRTIQVLTNLLSNAIKFSVEDGTVWVTSQRQGDMVLFQVADQGRGIPQDKLEAVFERFQQVDASDGRDKGGTGLGLAICRSIVQQHGGRIWAESTPGTGSTFSFTLPAAERQ